MQETKVQEVGDRIGNSPCVVSPCLLNQATLLGQTGEHAKIQNALSECRFRCNTTNRAILARLFSFQVYHQAEIAEMDLKRDSTFSSIIKKRGLSLGIVSRRILSLMLLEQHMPGTHWLKNGQTRVIPVR